jgi:hypothetical protein
LAGNRGVVLGAPPVDQWRQLGRSERAVIAIASAFALDSLDRSSANVYRTEQGNVHL